MHDLSNPNGSCIDADGLQRGSGRIMDPFNNCPVRDRPDGT